VNAADSVHKFGQLCAVLGGFYTGLAILPWDTGGDLEVGGRMLAMLLFILGLAVRYWWVVLLLDWPFRLPRVTLLLVVWGGVVCAASGTRDGRGWALALAGVAFAGAITEAYNLATGQWRHGNAALTASLYRDHIVGVISAVAGGAGLLVIAIFAEPWLQPPLVLILILTDWARLVEMIRRHQRLLKS
jgi:hypothetical protein